MVELEIGKSIAKKIQYLSEAWGDNLSGFIVKFVSSTY
jgi:hypothetical protein